MTATLVPVVVDQVQRPLRLVAGRLLTDAAAAAVDVRPEELIGRWLASKSPTARRSYSRSLVRFTRWALDGEAGPGDAMRLLCEVGAGPAHELVVRFRDHLLEQQLAPGTVSGAVTGIASLVKACRRAGLVGWSLEGCAPRSERVQDRSGPRRGDVERLVAYLDELAATGDRRALRDAVLVRLLFCCALRRSEACNLRVGDVQLEHPNGPAVQPRRKGKRARELVLVSSGTDAALRRWLEVRGAVNPDAWLLVREDRGAGTVGDGVPLSGESVRRMLLRRTREAGVKATIRPHGLRHSSASEVASKGTLANTMAIGGWKSLSAAAAYLDRRDDERRSALALVDL